MNLNVNTVEVCKLAYSVRNAARVCDLSRSLLYDAIKLGELQSIKIRNRRLILVDDLIEWLAKRRPLQ